MRIVKVILKLNFKPIIINLNLPPGSKTAERMEANVLQLFENIAFKYAGD